MVSLIWDLIFLELVMRNKTAYKRQQRRGLRSLLFDGLIWFFFLPTEFWVFPQHSRPPSPNHDTFVPKLRNNLNHFFLPQILKSELRFGSRWKWPPSSFRKAWTVEATTNMREPPTQKGDKNKNTAQWLRKKHKKGGISTKDDGGVNFW